MRNRYMIDKVFSWLDYQYWVDIHSIEKPEENFCVHFLAPEDFAETHKAGSVIEGELYVDVVNEADIISCNNELFHTQDIPDKKGDSEIFVIADVIRVVDEYSVYAETDIYDTNFRIEFVFKPHLKIGDRISVRGLLELDLEIG